MEEKKVDIINKLRNSIVEELNKINRDGISDLIKFLDENQFFTSPASSRFHSAHVGGLAKHSYSVFKTLKEKDKTLSLGIPEESVIICGLLHDVCKSGIYYVNSRGGYSVKDKLSIGHGEKSVILIQKSIKLTDFEIAMIRWHMNVFDAGLNNFYLKNAIDKYPQLVAMFTSDYESSFLIESDRLGVVH